MITDAMGQVLERQSFDAFGSRRMATTWRDPVGALTSLFSTRSYTGHEQLDGVELIHMNGRVYDPELGRFLSADPVVRYPAGAQGLNRYSYTDNNPLSRVDPNGYGWLSKAWKKVKKVFKNPVVRAVVGIAAAVVTGGMTATWAASSMGYASAAAATVGAGATLGSAFAVGAVAGGVGSFVSTAIMTGSISQGLQAGATGAFIGGALSGIGYGFVQRAWFDPNHRLFDHNANPILSPAQRVGKVVGQGLVGGLGTRLSGGNFADGLRQSLPMLGLGEAAQYMRYRMVMQSMIDPRNASGVSGGWFGDGFKLGGGRVDPDGFSGVSPLGGAQGGVGYVGFGWNGETLRYGAVELGSRYQPGSVLDRIVEAYAGPHDYLNSWSYNSAGQYAASGLLDTVASVGNALNVAAATPFVAAATAQAYAPAAFSRRW